MLENSIKPISDIFIHYLFGTEKNKELLLSFINSVLEDSGFSLIKKVQILNPFNIKDYTLDKLSILDIKAEDEFGHIYNIEIQVIGNTTFIQRSLYYWAKIYTSQLKENEIYTKLHPVICINLLDFILFNKLDKKHTCFMPIEKDNPEFALTDHFEIHFIELPKFKDDSLNSLFNKWLYYMKNANKGDEKMEILLNDEIFEKAQKEYKSFNSDDRYRELQEARIKRQRDEATLLYFAKQEAEEKGIEKGIEKGEDIKAKKDARKMLDEGLDIELIARVTGLTVEEIKELND